MSLRTTGLIAGVIGVILLVVGFVADSVRPSTDVVATASVNTAVVVYQPDFLTVSPDGNLTFEGDGDIVAYTARPIDAEAWLTEVNYTEVTGLPDWEVLGTRAVTVAPPAPSPSPSPSPDASASTKPSDTPAASKASVKKTTPSPPADKKATPSPSPSPSASPVPVAAPTVTDPFVATEGRSTDMWRDAYTGTGQLDIAVSDVPEGLTLVAMSADGSPLTATSVSLTRVVNDDWITPLLWWGAILVLAGLAALIVLFIDLRPAQARGESWMASRNTESKDDAAAGSRRFRRSAGAAIPTASLDDPPVLLEDGAPSSADAAEDLGDDADVGGESDDSAETVSAPDADSTSAEDEPGDVHDDDPAPDGTEDR